MRFRPGDIPEGDPRPGGPVDWEDNWLSNALAYASHKLTPRWCDSPEHWTARTTAYLFTDCPCCMLFRGLLIGGVISIMLWAVIIITLIAIFR